ncbi:MAG TPA: UPF0758 domain-containing protein, partial [Nitrospirota bacterium]|nr:UPF0758 domain-containing protein [Nitrospirota bacterium]
MDKCRHIKARSYTDRTGDNSVGDRHGDARPRERLIAYWPSTFAVARILTVPIRKGKAERAVVDLGRTLLDRMASHIGTELKNTLE